MDSSSAAAPHRSESEEVSDAIREAEAAVAALAESFVEWITEDIARAKQALAAATAKGEDNIAELRSIFDVVHNVKGQGGSFGYDLLTKIAASLCSYIREATVSANEQQLRVVAAHFSAIDFVLEKKLQGDGGEAGQQVLAKISTLVVEIPGPA